MTTFSIVVAADAEGGIGLDGDLPWHLPGDMKHFVALTTGQGNNAVIMGRTTWESIPERFRPLKRRRNIVMTRNRRLKWPDGVMVAGSFEDALALADDAAEVMVIGGASVYQQALAHPGCQTIHLTRVAASFGCDVFFEGPGPLWTRKSTGELMEDDGILYHLERWERADVDQGGG